MALRDRIYSDVVRAIRQQVDAWKDERRGLRNAANRVADLDAMIAEAEAELVLAQAKVPLEDRV